MERPIAMKPLAYIIPIALSLTACSTLRDGTAATDDVYDIPDRTVVATARTASGTSTEAPKPNDDYYDPAESKRAGTGRDYYDMAYNDPYYYNYGRFGFGAGISSFGPSYGMGLSYGWPTSFGSMSLYYGTGYGLYGYNPYWGNSWMSGYGYWPSYYGYDPYGYYGYGNYGPGWGGYGMGYGPYYGPWGRCYSCYEPVGYGSVYSHRPSMAGKASGQPGTGAAPTMMMRNPAGLMPSGLNAPGNATNEGVIGNRRPDRGVQPGMPSMNKNEGRVRPTRPIEVDRPSRVPDARPSRTRDFDMPSPSRSSGGSFGGGDGGGRTVSPRPGR